MQLNDFLERYGSQLAATVENNLTPVYNPLKPEGVAEFEQRMPALLRKPFPVQGELIKGLSKALYKENRQHLFITGEMGVGKAQPLDAKVLTPSGWKTMGEIEVGDSVIGSDGKPKKVLGAYPQGEKDIYHVTFTDNTYTECCKDHLWQVITPLRKWRGRSPKVLTLKEIMNKGLAHKNGNLQHYIPLIKPVEFPEKELPIHPYLLGALLGDGHLGKHEVTLTKANNELFKEVGEVLPHDVSFVDVDNLTKRITGKRGRTNSVLQELRKPGLSACTSDKKFIPDEYKHGSIRQRLSLLQGLLDTDGYIAKGSNTIEYSTTSKQLAEDVMFLVQSLGGVAKIYERQPTYTYKGVKLNGKIAYRLYIALPSTIRPFRVKARKSAYRTKTKYEPTRAIKSITLAGKKEAKCIKVDSPDGLYVTDNFILTHNTMVALSTIAMSDKPMRALVVCPTHLVEKWIRETKWTIPGIHVTDLSVRNVISILDGIRDNRSKAKNHELFVISKERAKLSYGWRPAAVKKLNSKFPHCPDCGAIAMKGDEYLTWTAISKKRYRCSKCGSALWQADSKLRRFAPAEYIKKYLKKYFDLVVIDEIQDYKAGDSLQGKAMGYLLSAADKCLCLTGTLNGGYADDLFHLLFRMDPSGLKADGFEHSGSAKWLETYGTLETIRKLEDSDNYYGRGKKKGCMVRKRPGVSPLVIGRYLLDKSCFIRLADVIDGLPPYEENVVTIKPDVMSGQKKEYIQLEAELRDAVKTYRTKALASMLQALLSYPDSCVLFPEHIVIRDRDTKEIQEVIDAPLIELENGVLLPKESELIKLARKEKADGRKVLCYLTFTGTRDIRPRLKKVLEERKFRVGILDASVEPKKREAWINGHAQDIDVLLVNAELVKTGLDLYDFPTMVFYQAGYNIFTLRQAARRSWRIGQRQPVKVYFFCYEETMQEVALSLIAEKLEVALIVEGDLPEGLAEYAASSGSIIEEMGKALVEGGDYKGAEAAWANFRKKEIEAQLGISGKESIFSEVSKTLAAPAKKPDAIRIKTAIDKNVVVRVTILKGRKKKQSTLEVKYGDLDSVLNGRQAQFALF